ncbi:MAG: divergent PAP2 family protein [Acidimicrobiales bacterium]
MDLAYLLTPPVAWLVAGSAKFAINTLRAGKPAFGLIGYGGMPSNHTAIVVSAAALIGLREGVEHPALAVAVALAMIVIIDARSLRIKVGHHAAAINRLRLDEDVDPPLRERMGHTRAEVAGGIVTGALVALVMHGAFSVLLP